MRPQMPDEKTNFDRYLARKLQDPAFRTRFAAAEQAWDSALQSAAPHPADGLTEQPVVGVTVSELDDVIDDSTPEAARI